MHGNFKVGWASEISRHGMIALVATIANHTKMAYARITPEKDDPHMNNILQNISPSTIPLAMDANKMAFGALLGRLPHAEFHEEPGLCWFETGVPSGLFNGVLQTNIEPAALPTTIERVLTHFQQRRLPFQWHIGPSSSPTNFGDLLDANGIGHVEDEPGMAIPGHGMR